MSLICTRTQQPAGQGGFHTGELHIGKARLRYIYDCGSTNQGHIDAAISAYTNSIRNGNDKPEVDVLFISHFDSDHIKGLETLFKNVHVKAAVIPYIDDYERLYIYAGAASSGAAGEGVQQCMSNPYQWLIQHEVESVFVVGGDGDVGPSSPRVPSPQPPVVSGYKRTESLSLKPARETAFSDSLVKEDWPITHTHQSIPFDVVIDAGSAADWYYLTYVHLWEDKRDEFRGLVGKRLLDKVPFIIHRLCPDELADVLKDPECVTILTECYDEVWKNAKQKKNATNLSLYSGPRSISSFRNTVKRGTDTVPCHIADPDGLHESEGPQRAGWLLTGDAPLKEKKRLKPFLAHYHCARDLVGAMMVPHHGSNANSGHDLFSHFKAPVLSIAAGMTQSHPHAEASSQGFACVTTADSHSALTFTSELRE
jgi:hypothetical protein